DFHVTGVQTCALPICKRWRYVGVFGPELMACAALVQVGVARQSFWAVWERPGGDGAGRLLERTRLRRGGVRLAPGRLEVDDVAADRKSVVEGKRGDGG